MEVFFFFEYFYCFSCIINTLNTPFGLQCLNSKNCENYGDHYIAIKYNNNSSTCSDCCIAIKYNNNNNNGN